MTLRRQLLIGISLVFGLVFIGLMAVGIHGTRDYLEQQLGSHAQDAASSLSHPLAQSLARGDAGLAAVQVATMFDRGYFQRIIVRGIDGTSIVDRELPAKIDGVPLWFSTLITLQAPPGEALVSAGWRQLGRVVVISQPTYAYQHLWASCLSTAGWMGLAYLVAILLTLGVLRLILTPLSAIERTAMEIGERRFGQISIVPRALELGRVVRAMNGMSRRIAAILDAESKRAEGFRKEAYQDEVTGLDNRRSFDLRFNQLLEGDLHFSDGYLIGLELDNLKAFNTENSYQRGNALLASVSRIAGELLGPRAMILGRTGGTSFGFVVVGFDTPALTALCRDLRARIEQAAGEEEISFSLGVVNFSKDDQRSPVMARLDLALEMARQSGRNALQLLIDEARGEGAIGSLAWRELIQSALAESRWTLLGQPVVSLETRQLIHHEIMSRLVGKDGQLVPASRFLPMALRHHLMADIDQALLDLVFRLLETAGASDAHLAVNLSTQSLEGASFVRWLGGRLNRLGPLAARLSFELTEYGCSIDIEAARRFAALVRAHRARFGIDHFGLAPNSLQILRDVPPDYIKLASGLVQEVPASDSAHSLLKSIVALAGQLEVEVIAQGIETAEQVDMLRNDRISGGQGYHFGAPSGEDIGSGN
ncbi:MAG: EAL domain-containing protein [Bacteroidota bacterium]